MVIFGHLDAITVLSRGLASKGIYPAVDPFNSTSKMLDPSYVKQEHFYVATNVKQILQRYKELQDVIAILGLEELSNQVDTIIGFSKIVTGKLDNWSEGRFYLKGTICDMITAA